MKQKLVVLSAVCAIALSACGGGGGGRPSTDEIADALKSNDEFSSIVGAGDNSDETVDCVAKAFHDSDLSDDALNALVDGDDDFDGDDADKKAVEGMTEDLTACVMPS
jgi:hypothetical protein